MTLLINPVTLTVKRTAPQSYDQTTFAPTGGAESTFQIVGELQPLAGSERLDIPEGYRKRATKKLYTAAKLRVISQETQAYGDIIELEDIDGQSIAFEVFGAKDRLAGGWPVSHNQYVLLRVGVDEG